MKAILLALILIGCQPVAATNPSAWSPLPGSGFSSVPGSAGGAGLAQQAEHRIHPDVTGAEPVPGAAEPPSSTPPTARPTGLVPPFVAIKGTATWWNSWGKGLYAAAGPKLRALMPDYLGRYVTACARGRCVRVRLTTSCACQPSSRIIDLSLDAFSWLADPSLGVLDVVVTGR